MSSIIFFILVIVVVLLIFTLCRTVIRRNSGKKGWYELHKITKKEQKKELYNDYKLTCPVCKSHKVRKITDLNRATSIAIFGLASNKICKQYECDNCKHKW